MDIKFRFNQNSGKEIIDVLIEALILGVIFLVPLWFSYFFPTYNIFELNKMILLRSFIWLILFFIVVRVVIWPPDLAVSAGKFFRRYWLVPTIFILGLTSLLLFSSDPVRSFFGTIERQQGLSSYLYYFLWFVLLGPHFINDYQGRKIRRAIITAALSATAVSVYGILQFLGIDFLTWPVPPHLTLRTFSSLGQPNFLASWLLLVGPISLYLFYSSRGFLLRCAWLIAFAGQLACFFMTGSRGGLLGLLAAVLVVVIFLFIKSPWPKFKKIFLASAVFLFFIGTVVIFDFISGGRIREMKDISYGSLGARVNIYQAAVSAWQERPWLGYGLENEENIFIKYYSRDWGVYGQVGQTADRAHNLFLDHLLTGGVAELSLFSLLIGFFFWLWHKNIISGKEVALTNCLAIGVLAYLFSLLVSFTIVSGEVYFWLFLAILVAINLGYSYKSASFKPLKYFWVGRVFIIVFVLVLSMSGLSRQVRNLSADHYFQKIYNALAEKNYFTAIVLDEYLSEQQVNSVFQESYDAIWVAALSDDYPLLEDLSTRFVLQNKLDEVRRSMSLRNHQNILSQARISRLLGNYEEAQLYLNKLIKITPAWPGTYYEQGLLRLTTHDLSGAIFSFDKVLDNLPDLEDKRLNIEHYQNVAHHRYLAYRRRGEANQGLGNYEASFYDYESAYLSNPDDYSLLKKIGDSYYLRGDIDKAIEYSQRGLSRNPKDYIWPLALASLYKERGDLDKAKIYFQAAWELAPDKTQLLNLKPEYLE